MSDDERPDADVMGKLHRAFGVRPQWAGHEHIVVLPSTDISFDFVRTDGGWGWEVDAPSHLTGHADSLPDAIDAAKAAARELLEADLERLEP